MYSLKPLDAPPSSDVLSEVGASRLTAPLLRQLLTLVLAKDSDLEALCVDYLPQLSRRFTNGMDRVAKLNLVLELESASAILSALRHYDPKKFLQSWQQLQLSSRSTKNPYRGLAAFESADAAVFFGRESLTATLQESYRKLYASGARTRLLAVLGPSGSGKSSVVLAGLLPALEHAPIPGPQKARVAVFKPGHRPIESLARSLANLESESSEIPRFQRIGAIDRALRDRDSRGELAGVRLFSSTLPAINQSPLLLIVDQFEEVYTLCEDPGERQIFVDMLLHAANDAARQVAVVVTLRSDFYDDTREHPTFNRAIAAAHVLVPVMSREELARAIAAPAELAGQSLDGSTVELLVNETEGRPGALPLLQFALTRIWEGIAAGLLPSVTLASCGGVGGALAGEAQQIFNSLDKGEKEICKRVFLGLLQLGEGAQDTRRRAVVRDLVGCNETLSQVELVLRRFCQPEARLITLSWEPSQDCEIAEVTHEALFAHWDLLQSWIDEGRDDIRFHRRIEEQTRTWNRIGRPEGSLWRSPELDLLRKFRDRANGSLSRAQQEFFDCSVALETAERVERERQQAEHHRREEERRAELSLRVKILFAATIIAAGLLLTLGWQVRKQRLARLDAERSTAVAKGITASALAAQRDIKALVTGIQAVAPSLLAKIMPPIEAQGGLVTAALANGYLMWPPLQHKGPVYAAAFSPDGQRILTAGEDCTARVSRAEDGQELFRLQGHQEPVLAAIFSPDGRQIATTSRDGSVRIFDAAQGALLFHLSGHDDSVRGARYSKDNQLLVTISDDMTARVWDAQRGELRFTLSGHTDGLSAAVFSPDGKLIATASKDGSARLWDTQTGKPLRSFLGHKGRVTSIEFAEDGKRVVTSSHDGTVRVWDVDSAHERFFTRHSDQWILGATFSRSGTRVLSWGGNVVRLWTLPPAGQPSETRPDEQNISYSSSSDESFTAAFAAEDRWILTGSGSRVEIFRSDEHETGSRVNLTSDATSALTVVGADSTANHLILAYQDGMVRVIHTSNVGRHSSFDGVLSTNERAWKFIYSKNGQKLLLWSWSQEKEKTSMDSPLYGFRVLDVAGKQHPYKFTGKRALLSADGQLLLVVTKDHLLIADAGTGQEKSQVPFPVETVESITSLDWSPDGKLLALGGSEQGVLLVNTESGLTVGTLRTQGAAGPLGLMAARVTAVAFSPDGQLLLTGTNYGVVQIWEVASGRQIGESLQHRDAISVVTFSPDGSHFLTAGRAQESQIWSAPPSVKQTAKLQSPHIWTTRARFTADGQRVLTGGGTWGEMWETATGKRVYRLEDQRWVDLAPSGQSLAIVNSSGSVQVHTLDLESLIEDSCQLLRYHTEYREVETLCTYWSSPSATLSSPPFRSKP